MAHSLAIFHGEHIPMDPVAREGRKGQWRDEFFSGPGHYHRDQSFGLSQGAYPSGHLKGGDTAGYTYQNPFSGK